MSGQETPRPEPRGEAAWRAQLERVAARNAEARRVGKQQRQEKERLEQVRRNEQERRMDDQLARTLKRDR